MDGRVGLGRPDLGVDAVQDAVQVIGARGHHAFQPQPVFAPHQLVRVGRADRGDRVGGDEPRLQAGQVAPVFQPVLRELLLRQAQRRHPVARGVALEGDVVDRQDGLHVLRARIADVGGGEPGLPVVAMHDLGPPAVRKPRLRDLGGHPAQRRETLRVVGIIAILVRVRPPPPVVEMRRVEQQHLHPRDGSAQHARRAAEQVLGRPQLFRLSQRLRQPRIGRHQHPHVPALLGHRLGQRAHDIGQPAGLQERHAFGRDGQDVPDHALSPASPPGRPACPA